MTLRKKLEYFWDYYKWHFIITIFVIYAISNIIYTNITEKEYAFAFAVNGKNPEKALDFLEYIMN